MKCQSAQRVFISFCLRLCLELGLVIGLGAIGTGCATSSKRGPASDSGFETRDGATVEIPGLRTRVGIPSCPGDTFTNECAAPDEPALFDEIAHLAFTFQSVQNPKSEKVSQRDFHPKQHACLRGTWTPLSNRPNELKVGIFAKEETIPAVVRFSNGSPKSPAGNGQMPPDFKPDARGLAIKLVGVSGESVLNVENAKPGVMNQDFVLINDPAFFLRSPKSYPAFFKAITQGQPFFQILDPQELKVLKETNKVVPDVSNERFFSQVPYVLGQTYAKYSVRPCKPEEVAPLTEAEGKDPNFLRARIRSRLAKGPLCLIFSVQQKEPEMKVEDATTEWAETAAPFVDVARIEIPNGQNFDDPARDAYCENTSFNPWNSLEMNRPAGAINRARLAPYAGISRKRRLENGVPVHEPEATDEFLTR